MQDNHSKWLPVLGFVGLLSIVALVLIVVGFAKQRDTSMHNQELAVRIQRETWYLDRVGGTVVDSSVYLRFTNTNQLAGFDGCNSFSAQYELQGSILKMSHEVSSTLIYCEDKPNEGANFINALLNAGEVMAEDDLLVINTGTLGQLAFTKRLVSAGLIGKWDYEGGAINAEAFSVIEGSKITLDFDEQGTFNGEACNLFSGNYTAEPGNYGELSMKDIISTDRACLDSGIQAQEVQFFDHLDTVESFEVFNNNALHLNLGNENYLKFSRAQQ
jgi:heat shock protein HslJ